jgi:hypothetical protein
MRQDLRAGAVTSVPVAPVVPYPSFAERFNSTSTTVTASATPQTKGSWSQLVAATTVQAQFLTIQLTTDSGQSAVSTPILMDIGFGAAASEVVVIPNISFGALGSSFTVTFPIDIPIGTRISARIQGAVISETAIITVGTSQAVGFKAPSKIDTYGADTATSFGVSMPTSNTYVQVTSATTQPYQMLIATVAVGASNTNWANATSVYTLGLGASGSEVTIATMDVRTNSSEFFLTPALMTCTVVRHVPAGTRIAAKQVTGADYRGIIVHGVPYS